MEKTPPSETLRTALAELGVPVRELWRMEGPKDTSISWIVAYLVRNTVAIVQTFEDGGGWDAFTPCRHNDVASTVGDVLVRTAP